MLAAIDLNIRQKLMPKTEDAGQNIRRKAWEHEAVPHAREEAVGLGDRSS